MDAKAEIERTFLLKQVPGHLATCTFEDITDTYVPFSAQIAGLRIRKRGKRCEITKKLPINTNDVSIQGEVTIPLTIEEYDDLVTIRGKKLVKRRYYYPIDKIIAEIDAFVGPLAGLMTADFEFSSILERDSFVAPDFCLAEVTQEMFISGGFLAGKTYQEISQYLLPYQYIQLAIQP